MLPLNPSGRNPGGRLCGLRWSKADGHCCDHREQWRCKRGGYGAGGSIGGGDTADRRHGTFYSLQTMMLVARSAMGTSLAVIMALSIHRDGVFGVAVVAHDTLRAL